LKKKSFHTNLLGLGRTPPTHLSAVIRITEQHNWGKTPNYTLRYIVTAHTKLNSLKIANPKKILILKSSLPNASYIVINHPLLLLNPEDRANPKLKTNNNAFIPPILPVPPINYRNYGLNT